MPNSQSNSSADPKALAHSLCNLADACRIQGRYAGAEPLYRKALALAERGVMARLSGVAAWLVALQAAPLIAIGCWLRATSLEEMPGHLGDESYYGIQAARLLEGRRCVPWTTTGNLLAPSYVLMELPLLTIFEPSLWVLVAPDCLGVLHDVRVTWEACERRGRVPDYLVLSAARAPDASTGTNVEELRTLGIAEPVQSVGRDCQDLSPLAHALVARFEHDSAPR